MAYAPRQYGLVPIPQGPDPMSTLSGLMQMGRQMQAMGDESKERERTKRVEAAFNQAKGDPGAAAGILEEGGFFADARGLREQGDATATAKRTQKEQEFARILGRVKDHDTAYGQGVQLLSEAKARPDLWPELRPKVMAAASAIDPRLADEIPDAYDEQRVSGMLTFANDAARRTQQMRAGLEQFLPGPTNDPVKGLTMLLGTVDTEEEREQVLERAKFFELPDAAITVAVKADTDARKKAAAEAKALEERSRPNTIQEALLRANEKGDAAGVKGLLALEQSFQAAGRAPRSTSETVSAEEIQALVKYPTIWNELTPSKRDAMLVPLSRAGFDFSGAATTLTSAQKGTIERWKEDAISDLNRRRKDPVQGLTDAEYETEKARIDSSYQMQMGSAAPRASAGPSRGRQMVDSLRPGGQPVAPAAPAAPATQPKATDFKVQPQAGGSVTVTAPDGTSATFRSRAEADAAIEAFLNPR